MFGKKKMTAASQYIMARGKAVGNLKGPGARVGTQQPPTKAEKVVAPAATAKSKSGVKGRQRAGALGKVMVE